MGKSISYCYKCSSILREDDFLKGKAFQDGDRVVCAGCAPALRDSSTRIASKSTTKVSRPPPPPRSPPGQEPPPPRGARGARGGTPPPLEAPASPRRGCRRRRAGRGPGPRLGQALRARSTSSRARKDLASGRAASQGETEENGADRRPGASREREEVCRVACRRFRGPDQGIRKTGLGRVRK